VRLILQFADPGEEFAIGKAALFLQAAFYVFNLLLAHLQRPLRDMCVQDSSLALRQEVFYTYRRRCAMATMLSCWRARQRADLLPLSQPLRLSLPMRGSFFSSPIRAKSLSLGKAVLPLLLSTCAQLQRPTCLSVCSTVFVQY